MARMMLVRVMTVLLLLPVVGLVGSAGPAAAAQSQEQAQGAILLVMDASGSMQRVDADGTRLIDGAKQALIDVVEALPDGTQVGLRVYGHRVPNTAAQQEGCQDTELISPVQPLDRDAMVAAIRSFEARGYTPIGRSLRLAASEDLPVEGPRTIVLVSDGKDTCAPPVPCEVAEEIAGEGIELKVETVGLLLEDEAARRELECIAQVSGGSFRDVGTAAELAEELEAISVREARRYQAGGQPIEGAELPERAATLEAGVTYLTEVSGAEEISFFRIGIDPGGTFDIECRRPVTPARRGYPTPVVHPIFGPAFGLHAGKPGPRRPTGRGHVPGAPRTGVLPGGPGPPPCRGPGSGPVDPG